MIKTATAKIDPAGAACIGHRKVTARDARKASAAAAVLTGVLIALLALPGHAQKVGGNDEATCGALANAFGPFEYRTSHYKQLPSDPSSHIDKLRIVENAHFTAVVETQLRGITSGQAGGDLDYTLRAFPNHHRALATLLRLAERSKDLAPAGLPRPLECYFNRAVRFASDDPIVRLLYSKWLIRSARTADARTQIDYARVLAADNGFTHYNVGLTYADAGAWDAALAQAHRAAALGFGRTELKQRLQKAGKWVEPAAAAAASTPAAEAASAAPPPQAASGNRP